MMEYLKSSTDYSVENDLMFAFHDCICVKSCVMLYYYPSTYRMDESDIIFLYNIGYSAKWICIK